MFLPALLFGTVVIDLEELLGLPLWAGIVLCGVFGLSLGAWDSWRHPTE